MTYRLRPLVLTSVETADGPRIQVEDPLGVLPHPLVMSPELHALAARLDGEATIDAVQRRLDPDGAWIDRDTLERVLQTLDENLLLDNARFRVALEARRQAFRALPVRPFVHAAAGYPTEPAAFRAFLERAFGDVPANGRLARCPRGVVAPHIDLHRGLATYARTWAPLRDVTPAPERVVILGTSHAWLPSGLALTTKAYDTPLGPLEPDDAALSTLRARLGDGAFDDELAHGSEHSIEFQSVFVKALFPRARAVSILVGSLLEREAPETAPRQRDAGTHPWLDPLIAGLRALADERTLFVASVDLAHVGPSFGDPRPLDEAFLADVEGADRTSLERACAGDAEGFWRSVARGGDPRNVCGLTPLYLFLEALSPIRGELAEYRQCTGSDQCVSIAGAWFHPADPS